MDALRTAVPVALALFAAGYAEPAEAKTGGDRHQLVI
jgi:hypothetical protein